MASVCRLCGSSVAYSHHRVALFGKKASQERLASLISALLDITLNDDDGLLNLRCAKCKQSLETVMIDLTKFKSLKVEDNPSWPNSSVEDSRKDEAAGLPKPTVKDDVWVLTSHDVECLAIGTGILGSGGGGNPDFGQKMALQLLEQGKELKIFNPFRMQSSKMDLLCAAALMGAPTALDDDSVNIPETVTALHQLEKTLTSENHHITGLICVETGGFNSFVPLFVAAHTGLPVLDVDGMGRSYPKLQMFLPFIYGLKPYPAAVADNKGNAVVCTHVESAKLLEGFFRAVCVQMGKMAGTTFGVMTMSEMKEKCIFFSMCWAWQLGRAVLRAQHTHTNALDAITEQQNGIILIKGKVGKVEPFSKAGFDELVVEVEGLEDYAGALIKIRTLNENYIAWEPQGSGTEPEDGYVLTCFPDLICVINSETGNAITSDTIHDKIGTRVGVLALPANRKLFTSEGMPLAGLGPQAFGLKVPYTPPRPLHGRSN